MNTVIITEIMDMRINLLKILSAASLMLLAVSCTEKSGYGSPFILFEIHGKVVDIDGNPIEGIQVSSGTTEVKTTNVNGNFSFFGRSVPSSFASLTFEDKDGDDNGGSFQKSVKNISLLLKTPGDESGNFKGTYFAQGVEVVMIPKEAGLDPDSGLIPLSSLAD